MDARTNEILSIALGGGRIREDDALHLYREAPLDALGETAHALRNLRADPQVVTYLIDRNVNYTNFCTTDCLFCAFYRPMGHEEGYVLTYEKIAQKVEELDRIGGTRVLLQGGHNPDLRISFYVDMLRYLKERFPHIQLDAFSPSEIDNIAKVEGMTMREVLETLNPAGQDGLPGGGAEILDDEIRGRISRKKQSAEGWLEAMEIAQSLGMTTSATNVIGFGESLENRINHLSKFRAHQETALATHGNGFRAFISWTFQAENTSWGNIGSKKGWDLGADGETYLRHVAIARIYLDNFDHHSASWPTQGKDVAGRALKMGCDDFGSTMMEENVVSAAGAKHSCLPEDDILDVVRDAGFTPVQRDSDYNLNPRSDQPAGLTA